MMDPGTGPKVLKLRLSCKKYKLKSWNNSIWHECLGVGGGSFLSHFQGTEIWNQEEISKKKAKETVKKDSLKKGHLVALALFSFLVGLVFVHGFSMTLVWYNIDLFSLKKSYVITIYSFREVLFTTVGKSTKFLWEFTISSLLHYSLAFWVAATVSTSFYSS